MAKTTVPQELSSTPNITDNGTATAITIDSSQNVGIGANDPNYKLDVRNGVIAVGNGLNTSQTNTLLQGYGFYIGSTLYGNTSIRSTYENSGNTASLEFYTSSGGSNTAEAMRIDSGGNVGIGTTSPSSYYADKLVVQGSFDGDGITIVSSATTTDSYFAFADGTTGDERYRGAIGYYHGSDALVLYSAGTERMRISSTGNVGIGTTPSSWLSTFRAIQGPAGSGLSFYNSGSLPAAYLTSNAYYDSTASDWVAVVTDQSGLYTIEGTTGRHLWYTKPTTTTAGSVIGFTNSMKIDSSGYLYNPTMLGSASANSDVRFNTSDGLIYYQTSSRRYKENIQDLPSMLDKVNALRPVTFDEIATGESCYGLIAEEVFEQIPELVNLKEVEGYDEPQPDNIPYSMLSVFLLKAIQEQQAIIDDLKARIETLEGA